jgi:TonB family protein
VESERSGARHDARHDARAVAADRPPRRARNSPLPHFPVESPAIGGRVTVTFVVEADGTVRPGSLDVLATTEFAFADAVREAVPTLRYRPAQRAGQSVAVRMTEEFAFVRRTSPQP